MSWGPLIYEGGMVNGGYTRWGSERHKGRIASSCSGCVVTSSIQLGEHSLCEELLLIANTQSVIHICFIMIYLDIC